MKIYTAVSLFFLSSAAGAHNASSLYDNQRLLSCNRADLGVVSVISALSEQEVFERTQQEVPYANLDFSRALNPYHDIRMQQIEALTPRSVMDFPTDWMEQDFYRALGLAFICFGILTIVVTRQWQRSRE